MHERQRDMERELQRHALIAAVRTPSAPRKLRSAIVAVIAATMITLASLGSFTSTPETNGEAAHQVEEVQVASYKRP